MQRPNFTIMSLIIQFCLLILLLTDIAQCRRYISVPQRLDNLDQNISAIWDQMDRFLPRPVHVHVHDDDMKVDSDSDDSKVKDQRRPYFGGRTKDRQFRDDDKSRDSHVHIHLHVERGTRPERGPAQQEPDYEYASCSIGPNQPTSVTTQNIAGNIYLRQKFGGSLEVKVNLTGLNVAHTGKDSTEHIHLRGLHVHEFGDLSNGCLSAGAHFNPDHVQHGARDANERHVGDWGNVIVDESGSVQVSLTETKSSLFGRNSIRGRAIVIHSDPDDLGLGGIPASLTTGNAGGRVACCVVVVSSSPGGVWSTN